MNDSEDADSEETFMHHLHHPISVLVAVASMMIAPALVALRPQREVEYDNIDFDFQED